MRNRRRDAQRGPRGMDPASQHGTSSPHAGPSSGRARRSLGRLVVTPTFAAGACILFAAILAYGTTQTHLAFRGLGPACAQASCSAAGHPRSHAAGAPGRTFANGYARAHAAPDPDANPNAGQAFGQHGIHRRRTRLAGGHHLPDGAPLARRFRRDDDDHQPQQVRHPELAVVRALPAGADGSGVGSSLVLGQHACARGRGAGPAAGPAGAAAGSEREIHLPGHRALRAAGRMLLRYGPMPVPPDATCAAIVRPRNTTATPACGD